ncbi:MAG: glycosyltransferase [Candidatus Vecturithrix sp.]|jgi:glycosyltransferase involved in cell wall biosynthesis|nr:glycosyltransferase [Candidatus Vecturithrix sp.]
MNILLIAYYYPPINSGGTERPLKMAKYLPRFGHHVTVLTHTYDRRNTGDAATLRIYDPGYNCYRKGIYKALWGSLRLGVEVLNRLGRYASIYSLWKRAVLNQAAHIMAAARPDVILATYPPVETLELGLSLSQEYQIPLVADFRDGLLFEPIEQKRIQQYPCIRREYLKIEQTVVKAASTILTVSPPITDYFVKQYHCSSALTISNGFDPEDFEHLDKTVSLEPGKFHIVHTGRFCRSEVERNVTPFIITLRTLCADYPILHDKIRLHLVGQIANKERAMMQDLLEGEIIRYYGLVDRNTALSFQTHADLLLLLTGTVNRTSMVTAKLFEYLYAGRPILGLTSQTYAETIIQTTGSGWTVHPEDIRRMSDLLYNIVTEPEFYLSLRRSETAIATFSWVVQMERLGNILTSLRQDHGVV